MLEINEQYLLLFQFKRVCIQGADGQPEVFYHKRGIYLKSLCDGYYKVYNNEMTFLGTINDIYRLQLLLVIKQFPLNMN